MATPLKQTWAEYNRQSKRETESWEVWEKRNIPKHFRSKARSVAVLQSLDKVTQGCLKKK